MSEMFFRMLKIVGMLTASLATVPSMTLGQVHDRYEGWCQALESASAPDLVQFLNTTSPTERNPRCITWAIHKLGEQRYEPAIKPLVKLLDFHPPQH